MNHLFRHPPATAEIATSAPGKLLCPALQSAILYLLVIVISLLSCFQVASAEGTVTPTTAVVYAAAHQVYCPPASSLEAANECNRVSLEKIYGPGFGGMSCSIGTGTPPTRFFIGQSYMYNCSYSSGAGFLRFSSGIFWVESSTVCPVHSTGTPTNNPTTCTCTDPYVPDAEKKQCVPVVACPANASRPSPGAPCACDPGYKFDAAGTSCIPEQYTISLAGLGGEVMPTKTRSAYAQVNKSDGTAKSGASVSLELTVVPDNDGQPYAAHVGAVSPNGGGTGADGRLPFVFTAPAAGGTHTITATCTNCTNQATGTIKVLGCKTEDIREVEDIPPNGPDVLPLTQVLERTKGEGLALLPAAQAGLNCVKAKLPGVKITGGTRTVAYQAHLREVWDKLIELDDLKDPAQIQACKPLRDKIMAHKECNVGHCITFEPATDSDHPRGDAFDVSRASIKGLLDKLRPPPDLQLPPRPPLTPAQQRQVDVPLIANWLASPPTCNLVWGGSYGDRVHFSIP